MDKSQISTDEKNMVKKCEKYLQDLTELSTQPESSGLSNKPIDYFEFIEKFNKCFTNIEENLK